jgi:hypothetical protein
MALPPLELFSLRRKPPCCRAAFSFVQFWVFQRLISGFLGLLYPLSGRFTHPESAVTITTGDADVAQLVEQLIRNQQVVRSIRIVGSRFFRFLPVRPDRNSHFDTRLTAYLFWDWYLLIHPFLIKLACRVGRHCA